MAEPAKIVLVLFCHTPSRTRAPSSSTLTPPPQRSLDLVLLSLGTMALWDNHRFDLKATPLPADAPVVFVLPGVVGQGTNVSGVTRWQGIVCRPSPPLRVHEAREVVSP